MLCKVYRGVTSRTHLQQHKIYTMCMCPERTRWQVTMCHFMPGYFRMCRAPRRYSFWLHIVKISVCHTAYTSQTTAQLMRQPAPQMWEESCLHWHYWEKFISVSSELTGDVRNPTACNFDSLRWLETLTQNKMKHHPPSPLDDQKLWRLHWKDENSKSEGSTERV